MRKADIKVGHVYTAKVDGVVVHVKVLHIFDTKQVGSKGGMGTGWECEIVKGDKSRSRFLGKKVTFESAAKFQTEVFPPAKLKLNITGTGKKVGVLSLVSANQCLGYDPSLVSGRCRCAVCKTKPIGERATRPFVNAPTVSNSSPPEQKPPTIESVSSSPSLVVIPPTTTTTMTASLPKADGVLGGLGIGGISMETDNAPHLIIEARAGTGKTTTMVEALRIMLGHGTHLTPSPEQKAVWDAICLSQGKAKDIAVTAFNKSIVTEIKKRIPPGVIGIGIHGMGFKAVGNSFKLWGGNRSVNNGSGYGAYRSERIIEEILKIDIRNDPKKRRLASVVCALVSLCKVNLIGYMPSLGFNPMFSYDVLDTLVDYYDIDLDGTSRDEVYPLVGRVLQRSLDVNQDRYIDFDDMLWLPIVLNLPMQRYDLLIVDEAQDLNRCQQAIVQKAGDRLVFVGDPKQAIYGFAGADCESMNWMAVRLKDTDRGCVVLPLTVTRRCGKAIVKEANKIVPEFYAHESNCAGKVSRMSFTVGAKDDYRTVVKDADMILCRVNAPLVSECFKFIRTGKKANIQGRDIGMGLIKTVEKMKASNVGELITKLEVWSRSEVEKENRKEFLSEIRIIAITDKLDCIMAFVDGVDVKATPAEVSLKINMVFTDSKDAPGIKLSSIHKAKGLEAHRVFLLEPEGASVPHPMARTVWAVEQEWNLRYVAITRAIEELFYVG